MVIELYIISKRPPHIGVRIDGIERNDIKQICNGCSNIYGEYKYGKYHGWSNEKYTIEIPDNIPTIEDGVLNINDVPAEIEHLDSKNLDNFVYENGFPMHISQEFIWG